MTGTASILPAICAMALSAGCASGGRLPLDVAQPSVEGQRVDVTPGTWDRVAALSQDRAVVVTLVDGTRLEGAFKALRPGELVLADAAARDLAVARPTIQRILARGERDGLLNGTLLGAGIGLGAAAAVLTVAAAGTGYVLDSAKWGAPLLFSTAGGIIGALIDRAHRGDQVVYVRR
jgi:hypothetical protein